MPEGYKSKQNKKQLSIKDKVITEELKREILSFYISGTEELKINSTEQISKNNRQEIRNILQILIGFEVIEESSTTITIRSIISPEKVSFHQVIKEMFAMTESMFQDAASSFYDHQKQLAEDVTERDFNVNKLYFLILRKHQLLLQHTYKEDEPKIDSISSHFYEQIARQLERIADHAVKIAGVVLETKNGSDVLNRLCQNTAQRILQFLSDASYFVEYTDKTKAHRSLNSLPKIKKDLDFIYKEIIKSGFTEAVIVHDSFDRILSYVANIAEITIDQALSDSHSS